MSIIIEAARMAQNIHRDQVRSYTGRPYFDHPARVAAAVACLEYATEEMVAAAFLHDVLEDSMENTRSIVERQIIEATNAIVLDLVIWLTNPSHGMDLPRKERKEMDRQHLSEAPMPVMRIKMVDRLDNLQELGGAPNDFRRMYAQESRELLKVIGHADDILENALDAEITKILNGGVAK